MKARPIVKVCNCAECGQELRSFWLNGQRIGTTVAGRIKGRPYCLLCLTVHPPPPGLVRGAEEPDPWQENAIRILEDG